MSDQHRLVARTALDDLEREIQLADRHNKPVSLVTLDVDDFKVYCQNNGAESGKKLVSSIFPIVRKCSRETDIIARLNREDFALILPQATKAGASLVAERLLEGIRQTDFPGEATQPGAKLTVSLGVATYPGDAGNASDLVKNADRAMYLAKSNGKNRVQLYDDNRRSSRRESVALNGEFSTFEIGSHPLRTVDLSSAGVKFSTSMLLPVGALLDLRLEIPGSQRGVEMVVRVVRLDETNAPSFGWIGGKLQTMGGSYEIAARSVEIAREDLGVLTKYLWSTGGSG